MKEKIGLKEGNTILLFGATIYEINRQTDNGQLFYKKTACYFMRTSLLKNFLNR